MNKNAFSAFLFANFLNVGRLAGILALAALANGVRQFVEHFDGGVPVDAGVGDGLAVNQQRGVWTRLLIPLDEVGLEHHGGDGEGACGELLADIAGHQWLVAVVFGRVAM